MACCFGLSPGALWMGGGSDIAGPKEPALENGVAPDRDAISTGDPTTLPPVIERRATERPVVTFYRSAKIHWQGNELLCLIRNVSIGGMKAKLLIDLPVDTQIIVEMRSGHRLNGRVAWCRDQHIGVEFAEPIDVQQVMNGAHCEVPHWQQRMPRIHAALPVVMRTSVGEQHAQLIDLSQGGVKVQASFLRVDDDVTVSIPGLEPYRGMVRWAEQGRAGIAFMRMVPFDALAQWALDRQAAQALSPATALATDQE